MTIKEHDALIVIDIQNDFCPGGALGVEGGDGVVPIINQLMPLFEHVAFTRDWHPQDHCSFNQAPEFKDGSWPVHCVRYSPGAEFHGDLHVPLDAYIVNKATKPDRENYDGFDDSSLTEYLRQRGVTTVYLAGLATDYCIKHTALGAVKGGFLAFLVENACRGVADKTTRAAIEEMTRAGVVLCQSRDLTRE